MFLQVTSLTPFDVASPAEDAISFYKSVFGASVTQRADPQYGLVARQAGPRSRADPEVDCTVPPVLETSPAMTEDVFFAAHDGLPREAPGTGPATLVLASLGAHVTAIDTHQSFLDALSSRAVALDLATYVVRVRIGDDRLMMVGTSGGAA